MSADRTHLRDIRNAIAAIRRDMAGAKGAFDGDELLRTGAAHHLRIIGDACRQLSEPLKVGHPEVPWRQIVAMRNILVDQRLGVDMAEVRDTLEQDVPALAHSVEAMLLELGPEDEVEPGPPPAPAPTRAVEFLLLFFVLPAVLTLGHLRFPKLVLLLLVAYACGWVLRRTPGFDRRLLWNAPGFRQGAGPVLLLFAASVPLFAGGVLLFAPRDFLDFPRRAPLFWALVMVLYPLVSAYPQELVYRAFLFERYRTLFRTEAALSWASALAFGFLHVVYGSIFAVALTVAGGYLFARTYRRSQSLLLSAFQHGLYGCLMFTIGLGHYFYRGHTF